MAEAGVRISLGTLKRMREMRSRGCGYAMIGRLTGVTRQRARRLTLNVPVTDPVPSPSQTVARDGLRSRAERYDRLVSAIARVMPDAVRP